MKAIFLSLLIIFGSSYASKGSKGKGSKGNGFSGSIRKPTVDGLVVMQPGTFDSNVCLDRDWGNTVAPRYDGGGFYVQGHNGNSIFVCPQSNSLVDGINYGDKVVVSGPITTDATNILTIIADGVTQVSTNKQYQEKVTTKETFEEFYESEYGDLVKIKGFVTELVVTFGAEGSILTIQDCSDNTIKMWWTGSIDEEADLNEIFNLSDDDDFVPSYFEMVGFAENYWPVCWGQGNQMEFQPRLVSEMVQIDAPCEYTPLPASP